MAGSDETVRLLKQAFHSVVMAGSDRPSPERLRVGTPIESGMTWER